jgi:hypothetical protein
MSSEPGLTGGAKSTGHRAPGLGADTDGCSIRVQHQHGLDPAAAIELPEELLGAMFVVTAADFGHEFERVWRVSGQPGTK